MEFSGLMELALKFRESKTFLTALDVGVFEALSCQKKTAEQVATELSLDKRATVILLDTLVALQVVEKIDGQYQNTALGNESLVTTGSDYRGAILKHLHDCWDSWSDFEQTLRQGKPARGLAAYRTQDANDSFIWGMDNLGRSRAIAVLAVIDFSQTKSLLDLGCGAATYSLAFAKKYPDLQVTALDLELSLRVTRENVQRQNMNAQFDFIGGSSFTTDWGNGYDTIWMSQFIHCFGDQKTLLLLEKAYALLPKQGRLLIHDFFLDEDKTSPPYGALFSVHMLAVTEDGRSYSSAELKDWLRKTGFKKVGQQQVSAGVDSSVLVAEK